MTHRDAPVRRASLTPFGTTPGHCPRCHTTALPMPATESQPAGAYCPRCPWQMRTEATVRRGRIAGLRQPIQAARHLEQRERDRARWHDTVPLSYPADQHDSPLADDASQWTTTDRVLTGAAAVFIVAALVIKHWPI